MMIKVRGHSALMLATGLFLWLGGPSQAAPNAATSSKSETGEGVVAETKRDTRLGSRHGKKYAYRKSVKKALKSAPAKTATDIADDRPTMSIPPSIANANAQLASVEATADDARAMSAEDNTMVLASADTAGDIQVVAADQLNDVDRALQDGKQPTAAEAPMAARAGTALVRSDESSNWDHTSLIGKMFIGFGALLTMASAARMFMS
jgi:hypothetical protein